MIVKLFTKKNCPRCPSAKGLIRQLSITNYELKIEKFDVDTVDGMAEAAFYTVMATPTILVCDEKGNEVAGWRGEAPDLEEIKKVLK